MDYEAMYDTAEELITEFGSTATLNHPVTTKDDTTKKVTTTTVSYSGLAVKTLYDSEAIGKSDGVIKAGDVKFVCQFAIEPSEQKDRIVFGGITYTIINVETVQPDGATTLIYIVQGRKA